MATRRHPGSRRSKVPTFLKRLRRLRFDVLESRQLLATTVEWISTASGNWNVGSNWSTGTVPTASQAVVINVAGATPTITMSSGTNSVVSITASDPLSITGGSLIVSGAGSSTIGGGLSMTGGSLEATGAGVSLTVDGATTVSGANLFAEAGAMLSLPNLSFIANIANATVEATGTGSLLSLPELSSIAATSSTTTVEAISGGDVEIPLVTQITGLVTLETNSATSILDVADLATFTGGTLNYSGGTLNASGKTQLLPALTDANNTAFDISGGVSVSLPLITSANSAGFDISGGSSLTLSSVTSFANTANATVEATGTGSLLSLPELSSIAATSSTTTVEAISGGDVEIPLVTQITGLVTLETNSATSILDVADLATFTGGTLNYSGGTLNASGKTQLLPALTDANNTAFDISGGVSVSLPLITSANSAGFDISGGSSLTLSSVTSFANTANATVEATGTGSLLSLPELSSIAATSSTTTVEAISGGDVEIPLVTQITGLVTLETNSATSILDVADLATFTGGTLNYSGGTLNASGKTQLLPALTDANNTAFDISGGVSVSLPLITSANSAGFDISGGSSLTLSSVTSFANTANATVEATGTGSLLSLPELSSIAATSSTTTVEAISGGDVEIPLVTQITGLVTLETNSATSILDVADLATFTGGTLNYSGGTLNASGKTQLLPALTDANNTAFDISGGVSVSLPLITSANSAGFDISGGSSLTLSSVTSFANTANATVEATGTGSLLSLPELSSIAATSSTTTVEAISGGDVEIPLVTQITGLVTVESENTGSTADLSDLTTFSGGSLTVTTGGTLNIPSLATIIKATITTDSTATFTLPAGQTFSFPSGTTKVTAGTFLDEGGLNVQGTAVLQVVGGLAINGAGGLSVAANATVDVSGNLLGNATSAAGFNPQGAVVLDGAGTSSSPQLLEAMSQDLGNVAAGYSNNFAYGTLELTANTYAELVDESANSSGGAPNAVYVNTLIVPAGATLNLNGLHLYAQTKEISGTITGGTVSPTTVEWISASSGNWSTGSNWSTGVVPTASQIVIINVPGASPTITISSGTQSVLSIAASDPLSITGGSLIVAANSTIGGGLSMTGGTLEAKGTGISLTVVGTTTVSGASLYAEGGATLSLSQLTGYTEPTEFSSSTFEATGTGSILSLPNLTSIAVTAEYDTTYVDALSGGDVEMPLVTQLTGAVDVESENTGSTIDLSSLTDFNGGSLTVTNNGIALDPDLTTINAVSVTLDGTGTLATAQWATFTSGSVTITAGSYTFAGLTDINASSFYAQANASLTLPGATTYTEPTEFSSSTFEATGTGSILSLPNLTSIAVTAEYDTTYVDALSGGDVEMPLVTQLTGAVDVESENTGSTIDLSSLTDFNGGSLTVTNNGIALDPDLTTINAVSVTLDGTGTLATAQWATFTSGSVTITAGSYTFAGLTDINASSFYAQANASLTLPGATTYTEPTEFSSSTFEATGTGSILSLPNLTSIAVTAEYDTTYVDALSGGDVEMPLVTQLTGAVDVESENTGSTIDLSSLTDFNGGSLTVTNNGIALDPDLTTINAVSVTLDGTGTLATAQWATFTSGSVTITAGSYTFAGLTDINASSFYAQANASLTLPGATTYTEPTEFSSSTFEATGTGSILSLPNLTSIAVTAEYDTTYVDALSGGDVEMPLVTQLTGSVAIESENTGSTLDLSDLTTLSGGSLTVTEGGALNIPSLATLINTAITTDSTATFTLPANQTFSFPSGTTKITTGTLLDQGSLDVQGATTLNVQGGLTINGPGILSTSSNSTLDVSGNFVGGTTNAAGFAPSGTVVLDSADGTSNPPQLLEVMSQDLGNVAAGFTNNFAYGTLELTASTYVELVDQSANSPGGTPEALYVNDLIVPAGATLNLNGLHLYAQTKEISGTITGGVVSPTTVEWISSASGNWDVASNWSTGAVPGSNANVIIDVPGASPTITISSGTNSVLSITASDPLSITGGSLIVAANSTIGGGLSMTGGTLEASGTGVLLTVTGTTTVSGANLYALGGATMSLPTLASYSGGANYSTILEASGTGSVLNLPALTTWEGEVNGGNIAQISALSGGEVSLAALTTDTGGVTHVLAQGSGSVVDLSALTSFISDQGGDAGGSALQATQSGQIKSPNLTSLSDVVLTIDGTGTQDTAQIASFIGGTIAVSGGSPSFAGLTTIDGSNVDVSGGVSLILPIVTEYTGGKNYATTLQASGTGSVLNLPGLTTWEGEVNGGYTAQVSALSGGQVLLAALTTDTGGVTHVLAQGSGSVVDLSTLTSFISDQGGDAGGSALQATQSGQIKSPNLTSLSDVVLTIDGTGTQDTAQIASFIGGTIAVSGGSPSFAGLTTIDGSNVDVSGGVSLILPIVTEYTGGKNYATTVQASGTGSVLNLPALTTWEGEVNGGNIAQISALSGGEVSLAALTTDTGGITHILAQGSGSIVDLSTLISFISDQGGYASTFQATQGGRIKSPNLTSLSDVDLTIDGTGTQDTAQINSFVGSSLVVSGGSPSLAGLSDIDRSTVLVSSGVQLTLPKVTSYTGVVNVTTYLQATGSGSVLALPEMASITGAAGDCCSSTQVQALAGGDLELTALAQVSGPAVWLESDGAGSTLDAPALVSTQGTNGKASVSGFQASNSGTLLLPVLASSTVGTIMVEGASLALPDLSDIDGTSVLVSDGSDLTLPKVTSFTSGTNYTTNLQATGLGSVLSLPELASINGAANDCCSSAQVQVLAGGDLELAALAQISGRSIQMESTGNGSKLNLSSLTTFTSTGGSSLTVVTGGTVVDPLLETFANVTITTDSTGTFTVPGNQTFSFPNGSATISTGTVLDQGSLNVQGNASLNIESDLSINGQGGLSTSSGSTLDVSGNLLGNTINTSAFNPLGTVVLNSATGTSNPPQLLEVMSQDLGNVSAGFSGNFAYGTLELTASTYVELVDQSANSPGGTPEALYVNDLIVPAGATLNLDGLHLYVHTEQINGTIISGGAVVSGEVYNDANGDGALDNGESGLTGWTVELTNTATNSVYSATTNSSGQYSLSGIAAGTYTLSDVLQPGFAETQPTSPGTYSLTLTSGQTVTGENFGDQATAAIGGQVFLDTNGDGTPENGEAGLAGWTVNLLNASSVVIATATTGAGGSYSFTGLLPGTYTVQVVSQSEYVASSPASVTLTDNNGAADTVNFGEFVPVSVGGELFLDNNGDGQIDGSDSGLAGWTVTLVNGSQSLQTTTGPGGAFSFTGVGPGTFTVRAVQQQGYVATTSPVAEAPSNGTNVTGLALGEFQTVAISGEVYNDVADSGTLTANDPGLAGWTVTLTNTATHSTSTTNTDSNGDYSFTSIGSGTYTISDVLQSGYVQTAPITGRISVTTASGVDVSGENFGALAANSLSVTGLAVTPSSLQSGTSLVVSWDDTNAGNSPIPASFTDHVVITNTTTGQVLGVADVPYNVNTRGPLGGGASAAQQYAFQLPNGDPGAGNIQFTVTADAYDAVSGGLSASGRTTSIAVESTLANYADLAPGNISAPATATPGKTVTISWTDSNIGNASTPSAWVDEILLSYDGTIANAVPVGTIEVTSPIGAGSSAGEQAQITIPATGLASSGSLQFVVVDNADASFFELNTANNVAIDPAATTVPLTLTLTSTVNSIDENAANPAVLGTVTRSGPTTQPLTVTLTSSNTAQFNVPATVTIPAGQSYAPVTITVMDDGIVDPNQTDTITASATGFQNGSVVITDVNTDTAALTVSFATSPATVAKGSYVTATVTRTGSDIQAATVTLGTNSPNKIYVPAAVTIPAGSASTTFNVQAIDDDMIEGTQTYAFTASAPGLTSAVGDVTVTDTDIPALGLSLSPATVSESAGAAATTATLTRATAGDLPIVVDIIVPAGSPVNVPASVTIPANATSVTFSVGVFNNGSAETIQAVPITAEVTTMTNGTPLTQGSASATLDVINANGPLLSVTFANPVVTQGESSATIGTVTIENAPAPSSPITVSLSSSDTTSATVPATVTIPAGSTSATFIITTPADIQDLGTVEPTIGASAANYSPGAAQLIVTDTSLPDVVVSSLSVPATALNGQVFSFSYTVTNQGTATAAGPWVDSVFITNQPTGGTLTPLTVDQPGATTNTIAFNGTMQPGQSYERAISVFAPEETGNYWIVVETDSDNLLTEATTANNTTVSSNPVDDLPSYTATVTADVAVNLANTPVPLSGTAMLAGGGPAQFQIVNIHIFTAGTDRIISAITNANGQFAAEFQPLPGEAGVYQIGAVNPGVSQASVQGSFDILGMSATPPSAILSIIAGAAAVSGQVTLTNLTNIPLSDLQATIVGAPSNLDISATLGDGSPGQGLAGLGTLTLIYDVSAADTSTPSGSFTIDVESAEGATVDIPVSFTVIAQTPDVVASPSSLQAGMLVGDQTIVELTLDNDGGGASGPLTVVLPSEPAGSAFLSLASSASIASIAAGGSTQVTLLLTPPSGLALGTYTGSIVVQGAFGSTTIPFTFLNQSSAVGDLDITTVDEYTYFAQGTPNLAGADVTVTSSLTNQVVDTGVTGSGGELDLSNLPEGYYQLNITASGHTPYNGTVLVSAGQTTPVTAFLSLQLVTTTFTVAPTSVQDNISVQVNTTFETNVPAPVITASPMVFDVGPLTQLGETEQVNLTITNHGLVAASDMELIFGSHPYYSITSLISDIGTLGAESSLTIPVILTRISVTDTGDAPCSIAANLTWDIKVINTQIDYDLPLAVINVQGDCPPGTGSEGGLIPITGAAGSVVYQPIATTTESDCNACETATNAALLQYSAFPDWENAGAGLGTSLTGGATNVMADAASFIAGLVAYLQATPDVGEAVSLIDTSQAAVAACLSATGGVSTASVTAARDQLEAFANGFQSLVNETDDIFGGSDWINAYSGPELTKWLEAFSTDASGGQAITSDEASVLESMTLPEEVTLADVQSFIARWNQTITYNSLAIYDSTQVPSGGSTNFIPRDVWASDLQTTDVAYAQVQAMGSASFSAAILFEMQQLTTDTTVSTPVGGICTQVQLQLDQQVVVTRSAFNATLEIQDDKTDPITNVGLTIVVHDAQGDNVTDLFDIGAPDLTGLTAVDGTGTVAAGATGQAVYTLIPTNAAAPTQATIYYVSAALTYQVDGMSLSIPFSPESITVEPSPSLTIRYFEQSAVYAQDPYSSQVEPSQPFALGVQVVNTGAGTANDVSITSAQPQIVSSLSGLLVNFELLATQVDGQNLSPSLTVNFGDIAPGGVAEGLFLMTSTIDGQFVSYNATFQDESGLGSPELSIINAVDIYNLIHLASEVGAGASTGTAFLVSDVPGASSPPDAVFLPDGSVQPVAQATDPSIQGTLGNGSLSVQLTDTPGSGWSYLTIPDPGNGQYELVSVTRSDGVSLPVNDFWQTDETFVSDGQPPVLENEIHILDDNGTGTYTLTFVPISDIQPSITSFSAVSPNPATTPVDGLQVTFNEPIVLGTLNADDLSLTLNGGGNLITSSSDVTVRLVSGSTYQIDGLPALDAADGLYTLTVNAGAVEDALGNPGIGSDSTSWEMASSAPAVATIGGITSGPRNTAVGSVSVTFTEPIDPASFDLSALSLTDDGSNLITSGSGVSITQEGPATFQVNGLSSLTTTDGDYIFTVDATQITDPNGVPGVGSDSVAWTMDTVAPVVQSFATVASPLNTPVGSIDVIFSKPIDPSTFTDSALSLALNGGGNLITSAVAIALVSGSTYQISGLSALDAAGGAYTLTVNGTDISDLAGNAGTNSLSTTWDEDTSLPAAPTDLAISPNTGVSAGLTDTGAVTLTGSLGATGLTVNVFDVTTNTDLGAATVNGTTFSMALNLSAGTTQLEVTAQDAAGNISAPAEFSVFVDETAPAVSSFAAITPNPTSTPVNSVDVTFTKAINTATFSTADLILTDNSGPNLITSAVTISLVSGSTYQIGGLAGVTGSEGAYLLTVNAAGIQDQAGNFGTGSLSTSWLMDTTPPTSTVSTLPASITTTSFLVSVTGSDPAGSNSSTPSGIASFAIFVSTNDEPFSLFATVSPSSPSALFTGAAGNTYGFYSIATDNAGNVQPAPTSAQATIQIVSPISVSSVVAQQPAGVVAGTPFSLTIDVVNAQNQVDTSYNGSVMVSFANNPGGSTLGGQLIVNAVNGVATFSGLTISNPGLAYTLQVSATGAVPITTSSIDVAGYELIPSGPNENLVWFGTTGSDQLQFTQTDTNTVQINVSELAGIATSFTATVTGVTGDLVVNEYDVAGDTDVIDGGGLSTISSVITVGDGNDTIIGGGGANTIVAGNGDNTIYGNGLGNSPNAFGVQDPSNTITVGNGNNIIFGNYSWSGPQGGNNTITAGDGNNTIYGNYGYGDYDIDGAEGGNNTITVGNGANTIFGNFGNADGGEGGNNTITAGDGNDVIFGNGGGDDPNRAGGNNFIQVGNGNDTIYGNFGGDGGEGGNNSILTGSGQDTIYGNFGGDGGIGGNNLIVAGGGNDTIYAHSALPASGTTFGTTTQGQDLIIGGTGTDTVYGWPAGYTLGTNTGDLFIAGTTNLSLSALDAVLAEWVSSDDYATRVADLSGSNGTVGANGGNFLISGTTIIGSTAVDEIFGTVDSDDDWYLVTSNDVLNNVDPDDVTQLD